MIETLEKRQFLSASSSIDMLGQNVLSQEESGSTVFSQQNAAGWQGTQVTAMGDNPQIDTDSLVAPLSRQWQSSEHGNYPAAFTTGDFAVSHPPNVGFATNNGDGVLSDATALYFQIGQTSFQKFGAFVRVGYYVAATTGRSFTVVLNGSLVATIPLGPTTGTSQMSLDLRTATQSMAGVEVDVNGSETPSIDLQPVNWVSVRGSGFEEGDVWSITTMNLFFYRTNFIAPSVQMLHDEPASLFGASPDLRSGEAVDNLASDYDEDDIFSR